MWAIRNDRNRELHRNLFGIQPSSGETETNRTMQRWIPPTAGLYKVNFDEAWNKAANRSGFGVVIRNSNG